MCNKTIQPSEINGTIFLLGAEFARAVDQLGLKSSRPLSQLGLSLLGPVYFQSVQLHTCTCIHV